VRDKRTMRATNADMCKELSACMETASGLSYVSASSPRSMKDGNQERTPGSSVVQTADKRFKHHSGDSSVPVVTQQTSLPSALIAPSIFLAMGSSSKFPLNQKLPDKLCDQCGAPSSWADLSQRNLTWGDNLRLHITSYHLSPRMWPLGYILSSPYSPFYLEQQMPDREWRDALEDRKYL